MGRWEHVTTNSLLDLYMIFPYDYVLTHKTEDDTQSIQYYVFEMIIIILYLRTGD